MKSVRSLVYFVCLLHLTTPILAQENELSASSYDQELHLSESKQRATPYHNSRESNAEIVETIDEERNETPFYARDNSYDKHIAKERIALSLPSIREADVMWSKRIWREIDTRQKMNHIFTTPSQTFVEILLEVVQNNPQDALLFGDEELKEPMSYEDVSEILRSVETFAVEDPETGEIDSVTVENDVDYQSFVKFRVKEDWIFNSATSKMEARVIAIAPIRDVYDDLGFRLGQEVLGWFYFPNLRQHLAKYEAMNPGNNAIRLSWCDVLDMRMFGSTITKESNVHDRAIYEYAAGRDGVKESERIKTEIFNYEHDLWSY